MEKHIHNVKAECQKQDTKWGIQNHNAVEWIAILTEEVGEAARESVDFHFGNREGALDRLKEELVQVAAVALQALESINRQEKENGKLKKN
jgi:hypothetical protein